MRKLILLIATALSVFGYIVVADQPDKTMKASGAHPESTNAPGEQTCAQSGCHVNATISPGDGVNSFTLGNNAAAYTPGETYPVTIRAEHAGTSRFGFEVVALDKNNKNIGSWTITDTKRTQVISGNVNSAQRLYVTHKIAGTPAVTPGVGEWKFNWIAPHNYSDSVKFYYVVNATNNDGTNQGDALFVSSVAFAANPPNSAESEQTNKTAVSIYPNPASNIIIVKDAEVNSSVEIFGVNGKSVVSQQRIGNSIEHISLEQLPAGKYYMHITRLNGLKQVESFVKQ
jgi:hypothetical protein